MAPMAAPSKSITVRIEFLGGLRRARVLSGRLIIHRQRRERRRFGDLLRRHWRLNRRRRRGLKRFRRSDHCFHSFDRLNRRGWHATDDRLNRPWSCFLGASIATTTVSIAASPPSTLTAVAALRLGASVARLARSDFDRDPTVL